MTGWAFLLIFTTTIAVLALVVAIIALRKLRAVSAETLAIKNEQPAIPVAQTEPQPAQIQNQVELNVAAHPTPVRMNEDVQVIGGRVLVKPTSEQIVLATLGRPLVRIAVFVEGMQHALRPQSRDQLRRVMRTEYRTRKSLRRQAAREAAWRNQRANSSAPASPRSTKLES